VYETVCAFLNRHGGTLLLGIKDNGEILGVDQDRVDQIKKDFVTAINNPNKINPACYLSVNEATLQNKRVLSVYIPESSQVHRCNGRIYDRNEDGDFDITDHTRLVADLYHRKQSTYSENKLYPYATLADLRLDLLSKVRKIAELRHEDHPWREMSDLDVLKSAQLYQTDRETGKSGLTLAGIMLLGKDDAILTVVPHHRTDLILRKVNLDRYDDRDLVCTNLIESYERIMAFVAKHLPDPFYLEGDTRISLRKAIFREIASNTLIHREYLNPFPAKLIIERGQVVTENSNKPHGYGPINPENFSPYPKNPVIARFFREIGRADELGSGMRKLIKYGKAYGGSDPEMIEGDIFRIIVKCPDFEAQSAEKVERGEQPPTVAPTVTPTVGMLLALLQKNGECSSMDIRQALGLKDRSHTHKSYLQPALVAGYIEMTLSEKPNSRLQKYRLTEKGCHILQSLELK
jgi:ATP-dependent DNA helicase RecG